MPLINVHHAMGKLVAISPLLLLILIGCSAPNKPQIKQEFKQLFSKEVEKGLQPVIISIGSGEGDSDNVYQYVKFDVIADEDVVVKRGWFAGISLRKGQKLYGGEVIMLYQKQSGSQWKLTRSDLKRAPSEQAIR